MTAHRLIVLASLSALGCGNEDKPLTPAEFTDRYVQSVCTAVSEACLMTSSACVSEQLSERAQTDQAAVTAGRAFMPADAQTCLDKVATVYGKLDHGTVALAPADLRALAQACAPVYRGNKLAGQTCAVDEDCIAGLLCDHGKTADSGRCGSRAPVAQGEGCANIGEVCPVGFYCGVAAELRKCLPKVGLGGACDAQTPCLESYRCADGTCIAQLGVGEVCSTDQDCATGFCEPYAGKCAADVRFANGSAACVAMGGT